MSFQIQALASDPFAPLFELTDAELARRGCERRTVDSVPGYPCRVSLADASLGETVLLVHYEHRSTASPFRASHAVYVREGAWQTKPAPGAVPRMLRSRVISLRGFDREGFLITAELAEGMALEAHLDTMLEDPDVDTIDLHFAAPGCFAARAVRT